MPRLIDADKKIARYCEENCGCTRQECPLTYEHDGCEACTFVREIEEEPAVDAEPVRCDECVCCSMCDDQLICSRIADVMDGYYRGTVEVVKPDDYCSKGIRRTAKDP